MASMAALTQQVVLESSLVGTRVPATNGNGSKVTTTVSAGRVAMVRAQQSEEVSATRRSLLSFAAAAVAATVVVKESKALNTVKLEGPPPPSGGLPGTDNSDQARDVDLPLKERFYLQPKTPQEAADRVKVAAQEIIDTKPLIARKAWPYVQNGLRSSASYLRFDLNTIVASKPKEQRKSLKDLTAKMLAALDNLDFAARSKSSAKADKAYEESVALLNQVLAQV